MPARSSEVLAVVSGRRETYIIKTKGTSLVSCAQQKSCDDDQGAGALQHACIYGHPRPPFGILVVGCRPCCIHGGIQTVQVAGHECDRFKAKDKDRDMTFNE